MKLRRNCSGIELCKTVSWRFGALRPTTKCRLSPPGDVKSWGPRYSSPSYPPQSNEAETLAMNSYTPLVDPRRAASLNYRRLTQCVRTQRTRLAFILTAMLCRIYPIRFGSSITFSDCFQLL